MQSLHKKVLYMIMGLRNIQTYPVTSTFLHTFSTSFPCGSMQLMCFSPPVGPYIVFSDDRCGRTGGGRFTTRRDSLRVAVLRHHCRCWHGICILTGKRDCHVAVW